MNFFLVCLFFLISLVPEIFEKSQKFYSALVLGNSAFIASATICCFSNQIDLELPSTKAD